MDSFEKIITQLAKDIHRGKVKEGDLIYPKLLTGVADHLLKGVSIGYSPQLKSGKPTDGDKALLDAMRHNVYVFSGFKTAAQLSEVKALLRDKDGAIRPFEEFKKDVLAVNTTYNVHYLRSEYTTAVRGAEMARRWGQIWEEREHLPYLRYETVGDSRVRPAHAQLDGIVRRVDDEFWQKFFPPNGWNCRCDVRQERHVEKESAVGHIDPDDVPKDFRTNVGETGEVLQDANYRGAFTKQQQDKIVAQTLHVAGNNLRGFKLYPDEEGGGKLQHPKSLIYAKPFDDQYETVHAHESGGKVLVHDLVNRNSPDYDDVMDEAKYHAANGKIVTLPPEVHKDDIHVRLSHLPNVSGNSNPDIIINNTEPWEIETATTMKSRTIKNRIDSGAKQANNITIQLPKWDTDKRLQSLADLGFKRNGNLEKITFKTKGNIHRQEYKRP